MTTESADRCILTSHKHMEDLIMKQVFDLIEIINDAVVEYFHRTGCLPRSVAVSRGSYRRLLEICSTDENFGNLIIGCKPLKEIETPLGKVQLVIDEMLDDTVVEIAA